MIKEMVAKFKQRIDEDPKTQEFIAEIKKLKIEKSELIKQEELKKFANKSIEKTTAEPVSQEKLQEIINKFKIK